MRRFNFRLESLLRIRLHRERVREIELARATGACVLLEARLRELREERMEVQSCSFQGIPYPVPVLLARNAYGLRLDGEIAAAEKELEKKLQEREEINREYLAASRDRKVLDKLKERRARESREDRLREEGKALDEIAMGLAVRSRSGERG